MTSILYLCLFPFVAITLLVAATMERDERKSGVEALVVFVSCFAGLYMADANTLDPAWSYVCRVFEVFGTCVYFVFICILISD